ncbi:putative Thioredoxin domain-containing protein [Helianthus annuus]|nr:putative Thioredoxin domain-containing protein [Helianthus annuus]KAJ0759119.1 putative Thioredoxin domain-containing protein [Helianthus annuus]KAJ0762774.1 putative Thioredoxin domain-containing protein [Helianthus annuus]
MGVKDVKSKQELDNLVKDGSAVMVHFWASWCEASKHMDQVFNHLSGDFPHAHFVRVCFSTDFVTYFSSNSLCASILLVDILFNQGVVMFLSYYILV